MSAFNKHYAGSTWLFLPLLFIVIAGYQPRVYADDASPQEKTAADEEFEIRRVENPENPCDRDLDEYTYEKSWYDETQVYINSRFCEPALWFDNFFATDRVFREGVAGTYIRWRNDFVYDEEESFSFKLGISASVELPGLQNRLRLTIESDEDENVKDISPESGQANNNSLGLQGDVFKNDRSKFNVTVSLTPRVRFRYRYTYPVYEDIILRFTQEAQWQDGVNSARSQFDIEKLFRKGFLLRAVSEGKVSEDFEGINWLQGLVLFQRINKKTSFSYESSVNGISEPSTKATNYRLGVRFRKNFHRKWLFYEIAPEMTWPVTLDESGSVVKGRRSKWMLFFRLEAHFGNAHKKRYSDYI